MKWSITALLLMLVGSLWGLRIALRHREAPLHHRWLQLLLPPATVMLGVYFVMLLLRSNIGTWNSLRLAIVRAWAAGAPLYAPRDGGAITGMIYGPVPVLLWSPALLFEALDIQLIVATLVSCAVSFGALAVLIWQGPGRTPRHTMLRYAVFVGAVIFLLSHRSTHYMTTQIHFDSIAIGMSLFSCVVLMYMTPKPTWKTLLLAACLMQLGLWSKQNAAPTLLAQLFFVGLAHGWQTLRRYTLVVGFVGLIIFAACSFAFTGGGETMLFNLIGVPSKHPVRRDLYHLLLPHLKLALCLLVVAIWLVSQRTRHPGQGRWWNRSTWATTNRWVLLLLTSLLLLPMGIIGFYKVGGNVNSLHFLYFLVALCSMLVVETELKVGASEHNTPVPHASQHFALLFTLVLVFSPLKQFHQFDTYVSRHKTSNQMQVYQYLKKHPGEVYFPWYPLPTIATEGKVYHFPYGVYDRFLSHYPMKPKHIRDFVPKNAKYIAFHRGRGRPIYYGDFLDPSYPKFMLQLLKEYRYPTLLKALPGWIVFAKHPPKP